MLVRFIVISQNSDTDESNPMARHENRTLVAIIVAVLLVLGFLLYRSQRPDRLDVDPHARREIEKAKRR